METVSIRNLRGTSLRATARRGKPLAITNHRALIAIVIPVATAWVEHLIDYNWAHVRQSIAEGEQAIASVHMPGEVRSADADEVSAHSAAEKLVVPLIAAVAGEVVTQSPESKAVLKRLKAALTVPGADQHSDSVDPMVHTVRVGELTAGLIEQTGRAGQTLALTHDRELIGIVIPVTPGLVQFLIEQNLSRVLYNIVLGENQLASRAASELTALDDLVDPMTPREAVS